MAAPHWLVKLLIRSRAARLMPSVRRELEGGLEYLPYYAGRVLMSPRDELRQAAPYLDRPAPGVIDLSLGAPKFDLVPSASTKLPAEDRGYPPPWGLPELRQAVAGQLARDNGIICSPEDEVLITAGATGGLSLVLDTFIDPGDRVVLFDPSYLGYPLMVRNRRGRVVWVCTELDQGRLRFPMAEFVRAVRGAKLVILNSPNNPTGAVFTPEDLEQVAWWCHRHRVLIFSDEVYERYQFDGAFLSIGSLPKAKDRTLTANSVSKSHALAAYRVGWLAGSCHLIRPCGMTAALQQPFVPTICQHLALQALRMPPESFQPVRAEFLLRRRYAVDRLRAAGFQPAWPAGAFFLWLPVRSFNLDGREFAQRLHRDKHVLVLPGDLFGPSGRGYVRLSYATDEGRLREGLNRLAEFARDVAPPALLPQAA